MSSGRTLSPEGDKVAAEVMAPIEAIHGQLRGIERLIDRAIAGAQALNEMMAAHAARRRADC